MRSGTPPSDFSGRGGRCGTQVLSRNSGRPLSISADSASTVAVTADAGMRGDVLQVHVDAGHRIQADGGALLGRAAPAHRRAARGLEGLLGASEKPGFLGDCMARIWVNGRANGEGRLRWIKAIAPPC